MEVTKIDNEPREMKLTIKRVRYVNTSGNIHRYEITFNETPDINWLSDDQVQKLHLRFVEIYDYARIYIDPRDGVVMFFGAQDELDAMTQALRILERAR